MAFTPVWAKAADEEYTRLRADAEASLRARKSKKGTKATKAEGLFKQVQGCVQKLLNDPRHPGLKTHKYDSLTNPYDKNKPVFEAHAQNQTSGAYRVFWCYGPGKGDLTIIAITPHP